MNAICKKCNTYFKFKGMRLIELLSGGTRCPSCGENIDQIIMNKKRVRK